MQWLRNLGLSPDDHGHDDDNDVAKSNDAHQQWKRKENDRKLNEWMRLNGAGNKRRNKHIKYVHAHDAQDAYIGIRNVSGKKGDKKESNRQKCLH